MNEEQSLFETPLGFAPIGKTLAKFAVPAIISNLVSSVWLYEFKKIPKSKTGKEYGRWI